MMNTDLLSERLKNMDVDEIDITSSVMNKINVKRLRKPRKILLIAALIAMTVSVVFAGVWIVINEDGSYVIKTEEKQWHTVFDLETNHERDKIYTDLYNELIEVSNREGKDLIGYFIDEGFETPLILTSNRQTFYSLSRMEAFYSTYDHEWIQIVENNMPDNYSLSGASAQITYSDEYYNSWIEHAENFAENGQLYYEEIDAVGIPAQLKLRFSRASEGTIRHFNASIVMVSSEGSVQSNKSDSEIVTIEGYDGVLTNLSGNYKLLEVSYDDNLLTLHANLKNDGAAVLIDTMKNIIKDLNGK